MSKSLKYFFLIVISFWGNTKAFEVPYKDKSYIHTRYFSLGIGSGAIGFANQEGISGDLGFSIRLTAGHQLSQYFQVLFAYQFSNFDLNSPDPLNTASSISTNASMNQESIQIVAYYPRTFVQPYVSAGFGGYSWTGVNRETALSFPINFFFPIEIGFKTYLVKNILSFDAGFSYHFMIGENQSQNTLTLLNINKVAFDTFHMTGTFTFHMF